MGDLAIFGFGEGGWGLALLEGALMTLLVSACGLLVGAAIRGLVAWARLSGKLFAGGVGQATRLCSAAYRSCSSSILSILVRRHF